jgi:hypothetical protein
MPCDRVTRGANVRRSRATSGQENGGTTVRKLTAGQFMPLDGVVEAPSRYFDDDLDEAVANAVRS